MTTQEQAINWWNGLFEYINPSGINKSALTGKYFGKERRYQSLTGREIEEIYKNEHLKKGVKVKYKDKVLTILNEVGFIGQRGKMIPCADDDNYIDDYCVDDLILFSGENIYLSRLREQYKEYKNNKSPYNEITRQMYYHAMRLFCLDTQLVSFNDIEVMEYEVDNEVNSSL